MKRSLLTAVGLAVFAGSAMAVTFSNVTIVSPPFSVGSGYSVLGNSISFFTPNAIAGDPVDPLRSGTLNIQYDVDSGTPMVADVVGVNLGTALLGSGQVIFNEFIFEIDCNTGSEIGGPIGMDSHTFDATSSMFYSNSIMLSRQVTCIRVKKSFTLLAPDTVDLDLAALAIVNQRIDTTTPEPASILAVGLGLGSMIVIRRRKK